MRLVLPLSDGFRATAEGDRLAHNAGAGERRAVVVVVDVVVGIGRQALPRLETRPFQRTARQEVRGIDLHDVLAGEQVLEQVVAVAVGVGLPEQGVDAAV